MKRSTLVTIFGLALTLPVMSTASTASAAPTAAVSVTAEVTVEVSDEEASEDDILLMIDLPIIAADARDAGIEEEELTVVLTTAENAGVSAGTTAEILAAEVEVTKDKGKRKGLSTFVKLQLAEGVPAREIAAKIKDRKDELKEMSPEEREALEKRIVELKAVNKAKRKALQAKRKDLRARGQVIALIAHEAHQKRFAELKARKAELEDEHKRHVKMAAKDHRDARGDAHEARDDRREAHEDMKEAHADMKAAHADMKAADTPEERKAAHADMKEAHADRKEAKRDMKEAKRDVKEAKKDMKGAKKDMKAPPAKAPPAKKGR